MRTRYLGLSCPWGMAEVCVRRVSYLAGNYYLTYSSAPRMTRYDTAVQSISVDFFHHTQRQAICTSNCGEGEISYAYKSVESVGHGQRLRGCRASSVKMEKLISGHRYRTKVFSHQKIKNKLRSTYDMITGIERRFSVTKKYTSNALTAVSETVLLPGKVSPSAVDHCTAAIIVRNIFRGDLSIAQPPLPAAPPSHVGLSTQYVEVLVETMNEVALTTPPLQVRSHIVISPSTSAVHKYLVLPLSESLIPVFHSLQRKKMTYVTAPRKGFISLFPLVCGLVWFGSLREIYTPYIYISFSSLCFARLGFWFP